MSLVSLARRKPADTPLSPERQELADQIAKVTEAKAEIAAITQAEAKMNVDVWEARAAVGRAEEAITKAAADAVRYLTETARGMTGPAPMTVRQARDALQDAQEHLSACEQSRSDLQETLKASEKHLSYAEPRLRDVAVRVIVAEGPDTAMALAVKVDRLQRELVDASSALAFLINLNVLPGQRTAYWPFCFPTAEPARSAVGRFGSAWFEWSNLADEAREKRAWEAALADLMRDAAASLPIAKG